MCYNEKQGRWNLKGAKDLTIEMVIGVLIITCIVLGFLLWDEMKEVTLLEQENISCKSRAIKLEDEIRVQKLFRKGMSSLILQQEFKIQELSIKAGHVHEVTVTAYILRKTPTYTGEKTREGIVAVSRDLLKAGWEMGKKVHIEGLGVFRIADLMPPQWTKRIDVWQPSLEAAHKQGVLTTTAKLL